MLGVDLASPQVIGEARGVLQDLLGLSGQAFGNAARRSLASPARPSTGPDRNGGSSSGIARFADAGAITAREGRAAEEVSAEEIVEEGTATAEQAFEWRAGATLLPREASIIDVAQFHGLALAIADDLGAHRGRTHPAEIAHPVRHAILDIVAAGHLAGA
ncbi:hypothetical protein [Methylobacterium variabile]|uniref:hypothetical protein n=1 Tax=Methylobacterium variabile TaxID=298794 RepID=UPI003CC91395